MNFAIIISPRIREVSGFVELQAENKLKYVQNLLDAEVMNAPSAVVGLEDVHGENVVIPKIQNRKLK